MLHTFNKPDAIRNHLPLVGTEDVLLLIEDGVYGLLTPEIFSGISRCLVLEQDVESRGLTEHVPEQFERIDYKGFVLLCTHHDRIVNWF